MDNLLTVKLGDSNRVYSKRRYSKGSKVGTYYRGFTKYSGT